MSDSSSMIRQAYKDIEKSSSAKEIKPVVKQSIKEKHEIESFNEYWRQLLAAQAQEHRQDIRELSLRLGQGLWRI